MNKAILDKFGVTEEWIEENSKQYEERTSEHNKYKQQDDIT